MQNSSNEPPGDKWQWDVVTWAVILLVAMIVLLLWTMLWPHGFDSLER
jgi:hypothetical protein